MQILVLNQYYDPDVSASAQRLRDLAEDLAAHHHVTVLAGRPSYNPLPPASPAERQAARATTLAVHRVPSTAFTRYHLGLRLLNYVTYLVFAAVQGMFARSVEVIVVGTDPPLVGLVGWWLSRLHRVPMVHLVWDLHPAAAVKLGMLTCPWMVALATRCTRFLLRRATLIIVPSESMRRCVIEAGARPGRVDVLSHWEDPEVIRPEPKDNPFSRQHGLVDRFVIMYSGNIGMGQNLELCIALAERIRDLSDAVVVLIGEGTAKAHLRRRVEALGLTNVRFFPYEPRERMRYSLATADLFVVPLAAGVDGCMVASKVFTVMASGRPFIAAVEASSDVATVVQQWKCGVRIEPGDVAMLAERVRWFYRNRAQAVAMGARGRAAVECAYGRAVVTPRYGRLLHRVAAGVRHPARTPGGRTIGGPVGGRP